MLRSIGKQSGVRGVSTEEGNKGYGGKDGSWVCYDYSYDVFLISRDWIRRLVTMFSGRWGNLDSRWDTAVYVLYRGAIRCTHEHKWHAWKIRRCLDMWFLRICRRSGKKTDRQTRSSQYSATGGLTRQYFSMFELWRLTLRTALTVTVTSEHNRVLIFISFPTFSFRFRAISSEHIRFYFFLFLVPTF